MTAVLVDSSDLTPEWMTDTLRAGRHLGQGRVVAIEERARVSQYAVSLQVDVTFEGAVPDTLPRRFFVKLTDPETAPVNAREVAYYTGLAKRMPPGMTVRCFDAAHDPRRGVYHLVLEDLSETHYSVHQASPPSQVQCLEMATTLADNHATWWDHPVARSSAGGPPTAASIGDFVGLAERAVPAFHDFMGDRLTRAERHIFELAFSRYPAMLIERTLGARDLTFVHSDVHSGNFLFPRRPDCGRTVLVDWHSYDYEPLNWLGAADLAFMICLHWRATYRREMEKLTLRAYHQRLLSQGIHGYSWEALLWDYRLCAIGTLYAAVLRHKESEPWKSHARLGNAFDAFDDLSCTDLLLARP